MINSIKSHLFLLLALLGVQSLSQAQQWTTTGTHIFNSNTGSIGVGLVPTGNHKLEILDPNGYTLGLYRNSTNSNWGTSLTFDLNNSSGTRVSYGRISASIANATTGSHSGFLSFQVTTSGLLRDSYQEEKMRITSTGNVGIGTTTPSAPLDKNLFRQ